MRGKRQRYGVETNAYIRVMIAFLGSPGDPVDESDAIQESLKLKCANNRLIFFRPIRDGFQASADLFFV
jgi:hypothetical protein